MSVPYYNMALNFATICRLCMQEKSSLLSLFNNVEQSTEQVTPLRVKIMNLAPSIKVEAYDGLPTHVCRQCVNQVNVSYNFKKQCEISDATFRECLKSRNAHLQSYEEKQTDTQAGSSDCSSEDWAQVKVKAEFVSCQPDTDSTEVGMEQEFPPAICSLNEHESTSEPSITENTDQSEHVNENLFMFSRNMICADKELSSSDDLLGSHHNTEIESQFSRKRFVCTECGKSFVQRQHLTSHMRTHTGERPYDCKECGKSFAQKVHLKNHEVTHSRLKPFSCSECGKCFAQSIHLKNHLSTHTGEKPYGCNLCGKTFSQNIHLKNHLGTHSGEKPYRCTECGKSFAQNIHLKNHLSTHTHEKPYGCTECGKTFAQNIHLKNHLATHTGEKPFGCIQCGKHIRTKCPIEGTSKNSFRSKAVCVCSVW